MESWPVNSVGAEPVPSQFIYSIVVTGGVGSVLFLVFLTVALFFWSILYLELSGQH